MGKFSKGWPAAVVLILFFLVLTIVLSIFRAKALFPDIPKLKSTDYVAEKLHLPGWMPLAEISPLAVAAIVTSEDDDFYNNRGFELESMWEAFKADLRSLKFKRGASTITQQVMKNTLLNKRKTLSRKIEELVLAGEAEKVLTKDRVLEIYLNTAQFGDKLYGLEEASRFYFGKGCGELTLKEGAYLAMLLPSPIRYGQSFRDKKLTAHERRIVDSILVRMLAADKITPGEFDSAEQTPLSFEEAAPVPETTPTPGATPEVSPVK